MSYMEIYRSRRVSLLPPLGLTQVGKASPMAQKPRQEIKKIATLKKINLRQRNNLLKESAMASPAGSACSLPRCSSLYQIGRLSVDNYIDHFQRKEKKQIFQRASSNLGSPLNLTNSNLRLDILSTKNKQLIGQRMKIRAYLQRLKD